MINDKIQFKINNMRIDDTPVTLFNKLYVVTAEDSDITGYWLDESGKLYTDNIKIQKYSVMESYWFRLTCQRLFESGEKALFYRNFKNQGVIEYANGSELELKERIEIIENKKPNEDYLKLLCQRHGGLTLHRLADNCYLIEIYKERGIK